MAKVRERKMLVSGLAFAEGPRWRDGKLWFSDMYADKVMTVDMSGKTQEIVRVPQRPSGLGFDTKGRLLIVSMVDRRLLRFESGKLSTAADLSSMAGGDCNDMVVDSRGRAYIGNLGYGLHEGQAFKEADLIMVDTNTGRAQIAAKGFSVPNGTVITPDGKKMIVAESLAHRITVFDVAPDGSLSNRRIFADLKDGIPDGICLDAEGAIWAAVPTWQEYVRMFDGGRIVDRIKIEGKGTIACMLGGPDRKTLFMLVSESLDGKHGPGHTRGWIETTTVDVPGAGLP
jgi:sugar lactone lactonase YvrE